VDLAHPEERENRQDHDAHAPSEVSPVDADDELRDRGDAERCLRAAREVPRDRTAKRKEQRREQEQPWDEKDERLIRRPEQEDRTEEAAREARGPEREQPAANLADAERMAVGHHARETARPERDRVGRIRGDGRHPGKKKSGERHEAAAARDGIDGAANRGGHEKQDCRCESHVAKVRSNRSNL